jgi:hypothetical protein
MSINLIYIVIIQTRPILRVFGGGDALDEPAPTREQTSR